MHEDDDRAAASEFEVVRCANAVLSFLEAGDDPQLATPLKDAIGYSREKPATVVVVGETGRGKSSLLNALLGRPDLLPVDFRAATSTCLIVRHGQQERAFVEGSTDVEIGLEDLDSWATLAGERQRAGGPDRGVGEPAPPVVIEIPDPLLGEGLVVIDTPGVGGLGTPDEVATFAVRQHGDAVLFVLDPSVPVSQQEIDFTKTVTESIRTAVFVLAKIDKDPDWRRTASEDQQLINARLGVLAESSVIGVSSNWKLEAERLRAQGEHSEADELARESGFGELEDQIRSLIGRGRWMRSRNLAHVCHQVLGRARRAAEQRSHTITEPNDALVASLTEEVRRLQRFEQDAAPIRKQLEDDLDLLSTEIETVISTECKVLNRWRARIDGTKVSAQIDLGAELNEFLAKVERKVYDVSVERNGEATRRCLEALVNAGHGPFVSAYNGTISRPDTPDTRVDAVFAPSEVSAEDVLLGARRIAALVLGGSPGAAAVAAPGGGVAVRAAIALPPQAVAVLFSAVGGVAYVEARRSKDRDYLKSKVTEAIDILHEHVQSYNTHIARYVEDVWAELTEQAGRLEAQIAEKLRLAEDALAKDTHRHDTEQRLARTTVAWADQLLDQVTALLARLDEQA